MAINELEWGNLGLKMTYNSLQADYKVSAIQVGHTRFLPFLANREVIFWSYFHENWYGCLFWIYKKVIQKKNCPFLDIFEKWLKILI